MENKKFEMLNTSKKLTTTHAELQRNAIKKGGRPKKSNKDKLNCIVSLNVNRYEKNILESKAASNGLNVVSLVRMSLGRVLRQDFVPMSANVNGLGFGLDAGMGVGDDGRNNGRDGSDGGGGGGSDGENGKSGENGKMLEARKEVEKVEMGEKMEKIENGNPKKVVKQYAVPVTNLVKLQLENRANEYMISVSELLKISLRAGGWLN